MNDIYAPPPPSPSDSFFLLAFEDKTEDEIFKIIDNLDPITDKEMLLTIFKKCKHLECRLKAGRILYY